MVEANRQLLVIGGSLDHLGGVEAFCDRSAEALGRHAPGWNVERIAAGTAYLRPATWGGYRRGLRALASRRRHRPDCVWLQYVNLPDLTYLLLARALGMRVMVTPHLGSNWKSQRSRLLRHLSESALGRAGRLALISPTQEAEIALPPDIPRSQIRNFLPEELLTAPLPQPKPADAPLRLIHSGRLSEGKGTHIVVEVCARLHAAGVPFEAHITGTATDPAYDTRLRALIAKHGLEGRVHMAGRVSEDDLLDLLRAADVLVHPSKIDSYPLIVLEALACATLPICMELAGARDMVETYAGAIVPEQGAAEAITAWLLAHDPAAIRERARAGGERVRSDYAWSRCAAALDRALRACTGEPVAESSTTVAA